MENTGGNVGKRITNATAEDVTGLLEVQNENLLAKKMGDTAREKVRGDFLVHPISREEALAIVGASDHHILLVAEENNRVVGCILCYDLREWRQQKSNWNSQLKVPDDVMNILNMEKVLYMRHIVRRSDARGSGGELLAQTFSEAKGKGYSYAIAEILNKPIPNTLSMQFSNRFGLKEVGSVEDDDMEWLLFMKKL